MLISLVLHNFVKHSDVEINFEKGMTIIKGPNGCGKSTIAEAIEFCLFGVSALRGDKSDYAKDLSAELTLTIKGKKHVIKRDFSTCTIDGAAVVGTKECNAFISSLLGFGKEVFEFSNYAKQFELMSLTDSTPAERKRMVDELIGAENVDSLIKTYKSKTRAQKDIIDVLKREMVEEPKVPEKPEGLSLEEVESLLTEKTKCELQLKNCEAALLKIETMKLPELPKKPEKEKPELSEPIEDLKSYAKEQRSREAYISVLRKQIAELPEMSEYSDEFLNEQSELLRLYKPLPSVEKSSYSKDFLYEQLSLISSYAAWLASEEIECPKCKERFRLSVSPKKPEEGFTKEMVEEELKKIRAWDGITEEDEKREPPKLTAKDIQNASDQNSKARRKQELEKTLEGELSSFKDPKEIEETIYLYESHEAYEREMIRFDEMVQFISSEKKSNKEEKDRLLERLKSFPEDLEAKKEQWTSYKTEMTVYEMKLSILTKQKDSLSEAQKEYDRLSKAVDGLVEYKSKLKSFVIPSLTSVASQMISDMSGGVLSKFEIDEDFNIKLDGKKTCLLSGSEKALANIALRLSLGRVLTKGVLSLFIADEIDASMSEERATMLQDSLFNLRNKLEQIIVITHKNLEGDNLISL